MDDFIKPGNTPVSRSAELKLHKSRLSPFHCNHLLLYKYIFVEMSGKDEPFLSKIITALHDIE